MAKCRHWAFRSKKMQALEVLTEDAQKSSEIEGEIPDRQQVRSSVARRLGMHVTEPGPSERHIDGIATDYLIRGIDISPGHG